MSTLRFDPEFKLACKAILEGPKQPVFNTAMEVREFNNKFLSTITSGMPAADNIEHKIFSIQSYDGVAVNVTRFAAPAALNSPTPLAAVLYIHGGAMVAGSVDAYAPLVAYLAKETGLSFFAVEYRLAPEYPAPAGIEDSFAALKWLSEHASELNVDSSKLSVMGDSAGGLFAASTALIARDRQLSPPLAKQVLIYPALDDRTTIAEDDPVKEFLLWRESDNAVIMPAYLGDDGFGKEGAELPLYAMPGRVMDLKGLPSTYIDVGNVDLFLHESIDYVKRLSQASVEVEMHVWPGLPHGWEMASEISWFKVAVDRRVSAIKRTM